jgi:sugar (pentulose or hexulose) kinase
MSAQWLPAEPQGPARASAASLYLAMMTATALGLSGGLGDIIVEGPFARNSAFLDMLAVATGRNVIPMKGSSTGTSLGAALLALGRDHAFKMESPAANVPSAKTRARMERWRDAWSAAVLPR